MEHVDFRLFSPVRPPRVTSLRTPTLSLTAASALEKCQQRETCIRRRNWNIVAGGIALIAGILVVLPFLIFLATQMSHPVASTTPSARRMPDLRFVAEIEMAVFTVSFLLALCVRKQSRADVAQQFLDAGSRPHGGGDPVTVFILVLLLLGLLYGQFLLIDGLKAIWVNYRLRHADRHRAALVLAALMQNPTGIDPRLLLQAPETPLHLRELIAYLVFNEWADVSPGGDRLTLVSPARHALREYSVNG
jgi:hypothetical protein